MMMMTGICEINDVFFICREKATPFPGLPLQPLFKLNSRFTLSAAFQKEQQ